MSISSSTSRKAASAVESSSSDFAHSWELLQSVADGIVEQRIDVGEAIAEERPTDDEISGEPRELLNEHRYLLEHDFDYERRREAVEAALISRPDRVDNNRYENFCELRATVAYGALTSQGDHTSPG